MKVAIIGTTSWGTTLGIMLARRGIKVALWARTKEEAERLDKARENAARLPGIPFPPGLSPTSSLEQAITGASLVILAVPSQEMRSNMRLVKKHIDKTMTILSAAKGLEMATAKRMSQVMAEELDAEHQPHICVLSGPNFSKEIARGLPASTVIAAHDGFVAERVREIMNSPHFQVQTSADMVGVELAGALKNIIALGAGMMDSLGYGDNAKAAFITRGLAEITRLGVAAGGHATTFSGLAGLGDLVATCSSPLSRNRTFGEELARGRTLEQIKSSLKSAIEGIATTAAALQMARELRMEVPIIAHIHKVLFEGVDLKQAMAELIGGV